MPEKGLITGLAGTCPELLGNDFTPHVRFSLTSHGLALPSGVMLVTPLEWAWVYYMVISLAGLQGIRLKLYEAAGPRWQRRLGRAGNTGHAPSLLRPYLTLVCDLLHCPAP